MNRILNLGIIGESPGNGHPYSWAAIFNGFNKEAMSICPYPVINNYLNDHKYPNDFIRDACVSHIWTQNKSSSIKIAQASKIPFIVENLLELTDKVDAILLARDDAENHYNQSKEFIKLGIPIFIDKPLALSVADAKKILSLTNDSSKIFTCSGLSYSPRIIKFVEALKNKGKIISIDASIRGQWDLYGMHLIEPILKHFINWNQEFFLIEKVIDFEKSSLKLKSEDGTKIKITTDKNYKGKPIFRIKTTMGNFYYIYSDTFNAFKNSLENFVGILRKEIEPLDFEFVKKTVYLLEIGNN